jgi:serine/threonine-protein kinase
MKTCPVCDTPYPDQANTCPADGAALIETRELAPGHLVRGKYRILRTLGAGGMGTVYLAEHLMLGGRVALKFLATELSRNPSFIKRFRQEARAAYHLRHPNIIEVADLDQDEAGALFIAMEYVDGPSLRAIIHEAPQGLPVPRALHIARGVVAGLAAAHARGAIHRDIKPENILLGKQPDGSEQAKVLDFGIAALTEGITNLSHTRGLMLTPEYAAPEQWRGTPAAELDGRTDLYALGGVLYEMLAGRTPFQAKNMEGWMFQHLQAVPEPLSKFRPDLEHDYPGLEDIVMCLLAREREDRYPNAAAFVEALEPRPAEVHESSPPEPRRSMTVIESFPPVVPPPAPTPVLTPRSAPFPVLTPRPVLTPVPSPAPIPTPTPINVRTPVPFVAKTPVPAVVPTPVPRVVRTPTFVMPPEPEPEPTPEPDSEPFFEEVVEATIEPEIEPEPELEPEPEIEHYLEADAEEQLEAGLDLEPESMPEPDPEEDTESGTSLRRKVPAKWLIAAGLAACLLGGAGLAWLLQPKPVTAAPVLSPASGSYPEAVPVMLSDALPGAVIHYTVDGTLPTVASPVYSQPLASLPSGATIRAMATAKGHQPSKEIAGAYTWTGPIPPVGKATGASAYEQAEASYNHKQYAQARKQFAEVCDSGDMRACNYLGYLNAQGLGGPRNQQAAVTAYQRACDKGILSSCVSLGSLFQDSQDSDNARKYFKKGCDGGLAEACELFHNLQ